jgi:hypothetical protein
MLRCMRKILPPNFLIFHRQRMELMWTPCRITSPADGAHVDTIECWDVCVKFYLQIFWYFKILKTRSICSRVPKQCCIENLLWHMGAYLLLPQEKALWKCKKIPNKNPTLTSRHAMSTFQVSDKQEGFLLLSKDSAITCLYFPFTITFRDKGGPEV